jgi:hypothetical protein
MVPGNPIEELGGDLTLQNGADNEKQDLDLRSRNGRRHAGEPPR